MKHTNLDLFDLTLEKLKKLPGIHVFTLVQDGDACANVYSYESKEDFEKDWKKDGVTYVPTKPSSFDGAYLGVESNEIDDEDDENYYSLEGGYYIVYNGEYLR